MSIEHEAEKALRGADTKAIRAELLENFDRFRLEILHVERSLDQDDGKGHAPHKWG